MSVSFLELLVPRTQIPFASCRVQLLPTDDALHDGGAGGGGVGVGGGGVGGGGGNSSSDWTSLVARASRTPTASWTVAGGMYVCVSG